MTVGVEVEEGEGGPGGNLPVFKVNVSFRERPREYVAQ